VFLQFERDRVDKFQRRYVGFARSFGPLLPVSFFHAQFLTTRTARLAAVELEWLDNRSARINRLRLLWQPIFSVFIYHD